MRDFLKAGLVYVPAFIFGRWLVDHTDFSAFDIGWAVGASAVLIRWGIAPKHS